TRCASSEMTEPIAGAAPGSGRGILSRLLPQRADNAYRGHTLALWLLALLLLMKSGIGVKSIFFGYRVATRADGIPLETFTPAGAQAVVSMFALWGLSQLMLCLLGILVLVRYRSMVPLVLALVLLEHLGRKLILQFMPIATAGSPPGFYVNLALFTVEIVALALSLRSRGNLQTQG